MRNPRNYQLLVAVVLYTLCFGAVFPAFGLGVVVHGNFLTAIGAGVLFLLNAYLLKVIVTLLNVFSAFVGRLARMVWWLMPSLALVLTALMYPSTLSVGGLAPAVVGGLILLGATYVSHRLVGSTDHPWRLMV